MYERILELLSDASERQLNTIYFFIRSLLKKD